MAVRLGACLLPTSINLMLHGITVSEKFLMLVGAKVLNRSPLLFYCGTMPVSLLVDQRKMIFYNKTLRSSNIVLRVVCRLHLYEAQRLFSVCHVFSRAYRQRRY